MLFIKYDGDSFPIDRSFLPNQEPYSIRFIKDPKGIEDIAGLKGNIIERGVASSMFRKKQIQQTFKETLPEIIRQGYFDRHKEFVLKEGSPIHSRK